MIVGCYAHKYSQGLMTLIPFPGRAKLMLKGGLRTTRPVPIVSYIINENNGAREATRLKKDSSCSLPPSICLHFQQGHLSDYLFRKIRFIGPDS